MLQMMSRLTTASLAATYFITPNASLTPALVLLTISALIFRAEIVLLLATHVAYHFLITKRLRFWTTLRVGIRASFAGLAMTSIVDTYFWQTPLAPELHSVVFNVIEGKAKAWGTSPFYAYGFDLLKLLLNPLAPFLIGLAVYVDSNVLHFLIPALSFVGLYSFQAHKEWRFIIYVVPQLTLAAAIGANYIFHRRAKSLLWRLAALAVVASVPATALISGTMLFISSYNYPGGQALAQLPLNSTGPVYLDVLTCMTGASRFLQSGPRKFSKTEDMRLLQSTPFWQSLEFAILQDPSTLQSRPGWTEYERIPGLQMRELKHLKWKKEDKLYIYRNTLFNITDRAEQSEQ
jgi:alpha-1,6-mannosyltransferase